MDAFELFSLGADINDVFIIINDNNDVIIVSIAVKWC